MDESSEPAAAVTSDRPATRTPRSRPAHGNGRAPARAGRGAVRGGNPLKSLPRRSSQQRWARKLHTWSSMFSLVLVLFFGVTGIVLNHTDWSWGQEPVTTQYSGTISAAYLDPLDVEAIASYLRSQQQVFGEVSSQNTSGTTLTVSTAGPGATSSFSVDTTTGAYKATKTMSGLVAFFADLHRGNSVGTQWGWVVDATAALLVFVALTGLVIGMLNRSRHWRRDMILVGSGLVLAIILLLWSAPR